MQEPRIIASRISQTATLPDLPVDNSTQILDRIYGAALDPGAWPDTIEAFERSFDGIATGLYSAEPEHGRVSLVELRGIDSGYLRRYIDHYLTHNPWSGVAEMQRLGYIRTDRSLDEYFSKPGYYHATALYNEWMEPQDFIYTLGVNLWVGRHTQTKFFLYRPRCAGEFSDDEIRRFRWLSGHLQNAVRVARRLAGREAEGRATLDAIDSMEVGIVLLDEAGRVVQANRFAESLFAARDGLVVRNGRLQAGFRKDGRQMDTAIRQLLALRQGADLPAPGYVQLRRRERRPLGVIAVPLPVRARTPFPVRQACVALIVSDPELSPILPADWLHHRYGLTGSETRLAQSLAEGLALREAADRLGLSYETARWYLKNVFHKTGTRRQPELVRLLLADRISLAPGG